VKVVWLVAKFGVGLADLLVNSRWGPTPLVRGDYLTALSAQLDSFWVPDHLNSLMPRAMATPKYMGAARLAPKVDAVLEPWTMLGYIAAKNRLGRMKLGVGVTDAGRRNPAVTAQAAATLHLLTHGRAILGIGAGEREGNEPYGVDWSKPVGRFIEAIATIRTLWDSGGKLVSRDSEFFPLRNAVFDLPPYRGKWPEIWVASHAPRMLRATGRYGDAWFPASVVQPQVYKEGLEVVRAAASDAGRDPMSIRPATWFFIVTGKSRGEIDDALGSDVFKAFALNIPAVEWERHGGRHPLGDDFAGSHDFIPQVLDDKTLLAYTANVPESLLRSTVLNGTPDEVLEQAAEWRDCGVRYAVVVNTSFVQPSLRKGLASFAPFMKILHGLRRL
jgi:phthiodiolone/phenolphthiodiolone dimycocerosates ketoreductase